MGRGRNDAYPPPSELHAALLGAACLGVWSFQAHTGRISLAPALARYLGLMAQAMPVSLMQGLAGCHPVDRVRIESVLLAAVETGAPFEAEFRTCPGLAGNRRLRLMGRAERCACGTPPLLRGLAFDLSEGHADVGTPAERTLRLANAIAEHVIAMHGLVANLHNPTLMAQLVPFEKAVGAMIAHHLHAPRDTRYH